jgi:hypothetical protein
MNATEPAATFYRVTYSGFLARKIVRTFPDKETAERWSRQAGVFKRATIDPVPPCPDCNGKGFIPAPPVPGTFILPFPCGTCNARH